MMGLVVAVWSQRDAGSDPSRDTTARQDGEIEDEQEPEQGTCLPPLRLPRRQPSAVNSAPAAPPWRAVATDGGPSPSTSPAWIVDVGPCAAAASPPRPPPAGVLHLLRDLDDAAQVYPDAVWPVQIADALRALIGEANQAREQGLPAIPTQTRDTLLRRF